MSFIYIKPR